MPLSRATPLFPLENDPGAWDQLTLVAATVHLEADGEGFVGQHAVAWVIVNRCRAWGVSVHHAILGPDERAWDEDRPWEQFSCWNDDYRAQAVARLRRANGAHGSGGGAHEAWGAAGSALWALSPDPTNGATHYLREDITRRLRGGTLPAWAADPKDSTMVNESIVTARIGHHTFVRPDKK